MFQQKAQTNIDLYPQASSLGNGSHRHITVSHGHCECDDFEGVHQSLSLCGKEVASTAAIDHYLEVVTIVTE